MTAGKRIVCEPLIPLKDAAEVLGLEEQTLYNWRKQCPRPFPFYKIGSRVMFRLSELKHYIEKRRLP